MTLLLLFSFVIGGGFDWQLVEKSGAKEITKEIKNSSVVENYGKKKLQRKLTRIDSDIFKAGCKVLIPKGAEVLKVPEGLKLDKTNIEMVIHERYTAHYEEGELKREWQRLGKESAKKIGFSTLEGVTPDDMMKVKDKGRADLVNVERGSTVYPEKVYFSFILIRIDGREKLLPIVLSISPVRELLDDVEGGGVK